MKRTATTHGVRWLALPLALVVVLAFDLPLAWMVLQSVLDPTPSLDNYVEIASSPSYLGVLGRTFWMSLVATALCAILGYVVAYWVVSLPGRWQLITLGCVILPFWVSILVRTYAWVVILGTQGVVNESLMWLGITGQPLVFLYQPVGVLVGMVNVLMPFVVLPLVAAMRQVDPHILLAARTLGSNRTGVFYRAFLPSTVSTLSATVLLLFVLSLGFFITPAILGGGRVPMVAVILETLINDYPDWGLAAAFAVVIVISAFLVIGLHSLVVRLLPGGRLGGLI